MIKIKSATVETIINSARNVYPNEFIALLGASGTDKVIDELVMVPATYGRNYSSIKTWLVPFDRSIMGSIHSHPGIRNSPSQGDLRAFAKFGNIHFIISYPYNLESLRVFNVRGNELEFEVVD
ncbi:MAG: Mov34/MPN/PAD-1 family protein [Candidatus Diapherotrites archaeon]